MLKRFNSRLQNTLIVSFVIVLLVPIVTITFYSNKTISTSIIERFRTQQSSLLSERVSTINATLGDAENKLSMLNGDQTVLNFKSVLAGTADPDKTAAVQTYFANVLKHSPSFKDIRIIGATGQEVVRVDNTSGDPRVVPNSELENKATRPYFINTKVLPAGQIYNSGLDLNVDQGKLDIPYLPVIRYATPLYGPDQTFLGILILKLFIAPIFAQATAGGDSGSTFYVLNADGSYWWNADPTKLYGSLASTDASFQKDYPGTSAYISTSTVSNGFIPDDKAAPNVFQFYSKIAPPGQGKVNWLIYYEVPQSVLFDQLNNSQLGVLAISIILLLVAIGIAVIITQSIVQPIRGLSQAMIQLGRRQWNTPIPVTNRSDEIGQLSESARAMAKDVGAAYDNLQKQTEELRVANALVKESARLKSEFMATMSHELRTPLNAMIGFSSILIEGMGGEIDEDAEHMITRIQANSERLLTLINGVLDIAKIEAGRLEMVDRAADIRQLAQGWKSQMESLAQQKELVFTLDIDPMLPEMIMVDSERLSQIVVNLLSNAFKFTDSGNVHLSLKNVDRQLQIEVADSGIGIPPHALNFIFEEFRQVDGSTRRAYGGTGLGLAIVRNLCRMMNGNVRVRSEQGKGSTFTVTLPLIIPMAQPVLA